MTPADLRAALETYRSDRIVMAAWMRASHVLDAALPLLIDLYEATRTGVDVAAVVAKLEALP